MEGKNILDESINNDVKNVTIENEIVQEQEKLPKIQPRKQKNTFKEKNCKVISYDELTHNLDISFDGYGIRMKNIFNFVGNEVVVKYKGEIGTSKFECKL